MSTSPVIAILLSTYNGARFLAEQLDSLLGQTYENIIIVARDDGSSDSTREILNTFAAENPARFHLLHQQELPEVSQQNLGASGSFSFLMDYALREKAQLGMDSAYLMFCDQDDVWFPNKVEKQITTMLAAEQDFAADTPLLVHTDLEVVSEDRQLIAKSFIDFQGLEIERNQFCQIAISNLVTGCTALLNEAAAARALPVSAQAIMHDWWLAMVVSAFGKLIFINEPLIHYRQHSSNTIGAKEHGKTAPPLSAYFRKLFSLRADPHLHEVALQAQAFGLCYRSQLNESDALGLKRAERMKARLGFLQRIYFMRARKY